MKKSLFVLLFLLVSILTADDAPKKAPIELGSNMEGVLTLSNLSFFEDKTKKMTIDEIKKIDFQNEKSFHFNQGRSNSAWWISFKVKNPTDRAIEWILKFNYGQFDDLQCWQFDQNKTLLSHFIKGDHFIDVSKTPFKERTSFEFETQAKAQNTIIVKISYADSGLMEMFHSLWSKDAFEKSQELRFNILVGIISALAVLLFYNIFIWFILRKIEYFWYNIYLAGVISTMLTFNQLGAHYMWSDSLALIDIMPFVSILVLFTSFVLFTREFLETYKLMPKVDRALKALIAFNLLSIVLIYFDQRHIAILLLQISSFSFVFFPIIGFTLWYRGYKIARGYAIASLVVSTTIVLSLLRFSEVLQTNELLFWIGRFGFIAEAILLSIALADRITILEYDYINAQDKVKKTLQEAKNTLESEVKKRTLELEIQTQKAQKLARTDEMTGIYNRRAFLEYGEKLLYEAERYKTNFSLVILDIDFFKNINDTYGHDAGDAVLIAFTKEISRNLRENDFFARIGGEEFVIVLPHTTSSVAFDKAHELLKKINELEIPYKEHLLKVTASMGITECNKNEENLYTLLAKADKALYYVKEHGRNNVRLYMES